MEDPRNNAKKRAIMSVPIKAIGLFKFILKFGSETILFELVAC